jgi:hypothetical protein
MVHRPLLGACRPGRAEAPPLTGCPLSAGRGARPGWVIRHCHQVFAESSATCDGDFTPECYNGEGSGSTPPCECRRTEGLWPLTLGVHLPA